MAKKGMDPEAVKKMASDIKSTGEDLRAKYEAALGKVQELYWEGSDGDKFKSEFADQVGQMVQQVVQQAEDLAEKAEQNASQQTDTSSQ